MLLAIDTSGPNCSSALLDMNRSEIVAMRSDELGRGHAEHLMGQLQAVLAEADVGWPDITRLACVTGPGSFTGLRVGLATARGLALARRIPCTGVTVFEAFAGQFGGRNPLVVGLDAKRGQVWLQSFDQDRRAIEEPKAIQLEDWAAHRPQTPFALAGSAAPLLDGACDILSDSSSPPIEAVLRCAEAAPVSDRPPSPLYLRVPDAKQQTKTPGPVTA